MRTFEKHVGSFHFPRLIVDINTLGKNRRIHINVALKVEILQLIIHIGHSPTMFVLGLN